MELSYFGIPLLLPPGLSTSIYDETDLAGDGKPFLILNYANGPGFYSHRVERLQEVPRRNLTGEDTTGQFLLYTYVREYHTYSSAIMADMYSIYTVSAVCSECCSSLFSAPDIVSAHSLTMRNIYAWDKLLETLNCAGIYRELWRVMIMERLEVSNINARHGVLYYIKFSFQ